MSTLTNSGKQTTRFSKDVVSTANQSERNWVNFPESARETMGIMPSTRLTAPGTELPKMVCMDKYFSVFEQSKLALQIAIETPQTCKSSRYGICRNCRGKEVRANR